jgi:mannose-6-phosphate isomerase-like protein (cupin superfamily)
MAADQSYAINYEPIAGGLHKLDIQQLIEDATDRWYNQTLFRVDDAVVRLGVFQGGEFHWHKHDHEDELFVVLDGHLRIEVEDREPAELEPRQAYLIPKGVQHRPIATMPTTVLMVERAGVVATGD